MSSLFVFGTLRHVPLLEIVAGEVPDTRPARLADHAVRGVRDEAFPLLVPCPGEAAEGLLVEGLSDAALARIDLYERIFDYVRRPATVQTASGPESSALYAPPEGRWQAQGAWHLDDWAAAEGALACCTAQEVMARAGQEAPGELARLYPFIRARSWTHLRAARTPAPTTLRHRAEPGDVAVSRDETTFNGFFRLKSFDVSGRQFQGRMGPVVARECFVGFDAALVLPYDPATDRVMLVEQLRFGPLWRGDPQPWTLEPIAGMLDPGETPEETARREAREETGLEVTELLPIAAAYPAPGYVTEFHHCFLALTDLGPADAGIGGLQSESENIRAHVVSFEAAMALADSGEINVAPLLMMLYWLARHRERLRAGAGVAAT